VTSWDVAPPAGLPWDVDAVIAAALTILRLDPADVDQPQVEDAALVATADIDQHLDWPTSPWDTFADMPMPVVRSAVHVTVEEYRRKDAPFGVTDSWSVDGAVLRTSPDRLRGVRPQLAPFRGRRGVA